MVRQCAARSALVKRLQCDVSSLRETMRPEICPDFDVMGAEALGIVEEEGDVVVQVRADEGEEVGLGGGLFKPVDEGHEGLFILFFYMHEIGKDELVPPDAVVAVNRIEGEAVLPEIAEESGVKPVKEGAAEPMRSHFQAEGRPFDVVCDERLQFSAAADAVELTRDLLFLARRREPVCPQRYAAEGVDDGAHVFFRKGAARKRHISFEYSFSRSEAISSRVSSPSTEALPSTG